MDYSTALLMGRRYFDDEVGQAAARAIPRGRSGAPMTTPSQDWQSYTDAVAANATPYANTPATDIGQRAGQVAQAAETVRPTFGMDWDAKGAVEALKTGAYGQAALKLGQGMASVGLDALDFVDPGAGTMLATLPLAVKASKEAAQETAEAAAKRTVRAYHGSPHDFDQFSLGKIGTGEGAQAYGHGLYFAENEDIARSYRDKLTNPREGLPAGVLLDNKVVSSNTPSSRLSAAERAALEIEYSGGSSYRAIQDLKERLEILKNRPDSEEAYEMDRATLEALETQDWTGRVKPYKGRMYEVDIKADPEHFLDWDKPLSEQSEHVRTTLDKLGAVGERPIPYGELQRDFLNPLSNELGTHPAARVINPESLLYGQLDTAEVMKALADDPARQHQVQRILDSFKARQQLRGEEVYKSLADAYDTGVTGASRNTEAVAALREAGIPGIKYLDAGSRGAGEGSRNYVVFSDALIEIARKYGIPLTFLLGGAYGLGQGGAPPPRDDREES